MYGVWYSLFLTTVTCLLPTLQNLSVLTTRTMFSPTYLYLLLVAIHAQQKWKAMNIKHQMQWEVNFLVISMRPNLLASYFLLTCYCSSYRAKFPPIYFCIRMKITQKRTHRPHWNLVSAERAYFYVSIFLQLENMTWILSWDIKKKWNLEIAKKYKKCHLLVLFNRESSNFWMNML